MGNDTGYPEQHHPSHGKGKVDTSTAAEYLVRKRRGYYRPNSCGYTESPIVAGRYTLAQAIDETHPNGPDGPRDGMDYVHEVDLTDEAWLAHIAAISALVAERDAAIARAEQAEAERDAWKAQSLLKNGVANSALAEAARIAELEDDFKTAYDLVADARMRLDTGFAQLGDTIDYHPATVTFIDGNLNEALAIARAALAGEGGE